MTQGHTAEGLSVKRQIIANKITIKTDLRMLFINGFGFQKVIENGKNAIKRR